MMFQVLFLCAQFVLYMYGRIEVSSLRHDKVKDFSNVCIDLYGKYKVIRMKPESIKAETCIEKWGVADESLKR